MQMEHFLCDAEQKLISVDFFLLQHDLRSGGDSFKLFKRISHNGF